jgi:hypothetical protein
MKLAKVGATLAASALALFGLGVAAAPAASAVDVLANCLDGAGFGDIQEIIATPGETITISGGEAACFFASTNPQYTGEPIDFFASWPYAPNTSGGIFPIEGIGVWVIMPNVELGSTDALLFVAGDCDFADECMTTYYITVVAGTPLPTPSPGAPPPPDMIQEVGMPASGSCDAVNDTGMDFGTKLTGGWKQSWSEWPNDGKGGLVCGRALHYSLALHQWVLS